MGRIKITHALITMLCQNIELTSPTLGLTSGDREDWGLYFIESTLLLFYLRHVMCHHYANHVDTHAHKLERCTFTYQNICMGFVKSRFFRWSNLKFNKTSKFTLIL